MSSSTVWRVNVAKRARKIIAHVPKYDQERLRTVLEEMESDPFTGDVERLKQERTAFRRRVGDWWIFPSPVGVTASATTSGTAEADAERSKVLTPTMTGAGGVFEQPKLKRTSVDEKAAMGVMARTKLCESPAGIDTGVFSVPVISFVPGFAVCYVNVAGMLLMGRCRSL